MGNEHENGRFYPKMALENAKARRQGIVAEVHEALVQIQREQTNYSLRLDTVEDKLERQLEVVAGNTTAMSRSLEAIQVTNSKLVDVITNRSSVPAIVMIFVTAMIAGIFLTRELAISGGRAKINLQGVDINAGAPTK